MLSATKETIMTKQETIRAVAVPDEELLKQYGMTYDEWQEARKEQGCSVWRRK